MRDIGLNARGKLDRVTREIAAGLNIPHNNGASNINLNMITETGVAEIET